MSADKISRQTLLGHSKGPSLHFEAAKPPTAPSEPSEKPLGPYQGMTIQIHEIKPGPNVSVEHPCFVGRHRWAYLTNGGVACGYCGTPRRG